MVRPSNKSKRRAPLNTNYSPGRTPHQRGIRLNIDSRAGRRLLTLARLLPLVIFLLGLFGASHSAVEAQSTGSPLTGRAGERDALRAIQAATFRFNDRYTTRSARPTRTFGSFNPIS